MKEKWQKELYPSKYYTLALIYKSFNDTDYVHYHSLEQAKQAAKEHLQNDGCSDLVKVKIYECSEINIIKKSDIL